MAKIAPAHLDLRFNLSTTNGSEVATGDIDLARALSAVNRRLYRQGMLYYVEGVSILTAPDAAPIGTLVVQTAPDSWMVHNAWNKGFHMWKEQRAKAMDQMPGISGKWADFKIELDDNSTTVLETTASDAGTIVPDEWELSEVFWEDDGTEYSPSMCLLGASNALPPTTKASLVQEYHISRVIPQSQEPRVSNDASAGLYSLVNAENEHELSEDIILDISGDNDAAPYDADEMAGGDTVADCPMTIRAGGVSYFSPQSRLTGFKVPCGLMRVVVGVYQADSQPLTSGTAGLSFIVHLAPGPYKGVMAEPMGQ